MAIHKVHRLIDRLIDILFSCMIEKWCNIVYKICVKCMFEINFTPFMNQVFHLNKKMQIQKKIFNGTLSFSSASLTVY